MICRHQVEQAVCIVEECRADGLADVLRQLVEVGSPHDANCPKDDTCECKLAALVKRALSNQRARLAHRDRISSDKCNASDNVTGRQKSGVNDGLVQERRV